MLQIPSKPVTESRPGIIKSKSFGNPTQFECSIEESAGKKLQMMSFFSNRERNSSANARITNVCDDNEEEDEDLVDIDAEFESLLNKTFEKESRKLSTGKIRNSPKDYFNVEVQFFSTS